MNGTGPFKYWTGKTLASMERDVIVEVFLYFDGNKSMTARALGVCVKTLYNKLEKYGIIGFSTNDMVLKKDTSTPQMQQLLRNFPDARRLLRKKQDAYRRYMKVRGDK